MNMRDPITEWENAIISRIETMAVVILLLSLVCFLVAPVFSPWIKQYKRKQYILFPDYEAKTEKEMKKIRYILWSMAIIGWIFVGICWTSYP